MPAAARKTDSSSLQMQTLIAATPEAVWAAFTDPIHLVRWFPLQASIVPGVGGELRLFWGDTGSVWAISAWRPGQLLEVEELHPFASKTEEIGGSELGDTSSSWRISIEQVSRLQSLVVLEHFDLDASSSVRSIVSRGWQFELLSLRYYLERHFGRDRSTVWVRKNVKCGAGREAEIWKSLLEDESTLPGTVILEQTEIVDSPWQFAATLTTPASSLFRVKVQRVDQREVEVNLWLTAYDPSPNGLRDAQADFEQRISRLENVASGISKGLALDEAGLRSWSTGTCEIGPLFHLPSRITGTPVDCSMQRRAPGIERRGDVF